MKKMIIFCLSIFSINSIWATEFVAHKGIWTDFIYPQNTMESLQLAVDRGFRGLEFDVHLSKDGVPFLAHDPGIGRISSNCKGKIHETKAVDLDKCIIHKSALWTVSQIALKKVQKPSPYARMETVLDRFLSDPKVNFIWIDYKVQDIETGLPQIVTMLSKYNQEQREKILFNNGNLEYLRELKKHFPNLKTSFEKPLGAEPAREQDFFLSLASEGTVDMIGVGIGLSLGHEPIWWLIGRRQRLYRKLEEFMPKAKDSDVPVIFWTLKKVKDIKRWIKLNPDYLLTDLAHLPVLK